MIPLASKNIPITIVQNSFIIARARHKWSRGNNRPGSIWPSNVSQKNPSPAISHRNGTFAPPLSLSPLSLSHPRATEWNPAIFSNTWQTVRSPSVSMEFNRLTPRNIPLYNYRLLLQHCKHFRLTRRTILEVCIRVFSRAHFEVGGEKGGAGGSTSKLRR